MSRQPRRLSTPGETVGVRCRGLRGMLSVALHRRLPGPPVEARASIAHGFKNAEAVELAQPSRSVSAHQQGLMVGAGFGVRNPIVEHHARDADHPVGAGDDGALASAPLGDVAAEVLQLEVAGADGTMRGLDERGAQIP